MRAFRIGALGALALLLGGCFAYVPVDPGAVRPDDDVRARVSAARAAELDPLLMRDARVLEGRVLEAGGDLLLEVPVASDLRGVRVETLHQRIRLPQQDVLELELRRFDRTRTALVLGSGLAVALAVVIHQLTRESGGDTQPPGPDPTELRIPLFRVPLGLRP